MTVIHADTGSAMRGGQWQVLSLMRGLRARGVNQVLMTPRNSLLAAKAREEGFDWRRLVPWRLGGGDLVHAHSAGAHTSAWLGRAPRLIVSRRVGFPIQRNLVSRWKYRAPALFLAVSEFVRARLIEYGIAGERIRVVYDGVEMLPRAQARRIVTPAFDDPLKGADLIRQAAELARVDVQFSTDLAADLTDARAFVYITESEGLGSAILLAQSAGVPVIASEVGGIPEIVRHGETGLLVDNSVASIAAALLKFKGDGYPAAMGEAARRQVQERFSLDRMVDATLAAYREVVHV